MSTTLLKRWHFGFILRTFFATPYGSNLWWITCLQRNILVWKKHHRGQIRWALLLQPPPQTPLWTDCSWKGAHWRMSRYSLYFLLPTTSKYPCQILQQCTPIGSKTEHGSVSFMLSEHINQLFRRPWKGTLIYSFPHSLLWLQQDDWQTIQAINPCQVWIQLIRILAQP